MASSTLVGRRVRTASGGEGVVIKWEPLGAGLTDALVRFNGGHEVWYASHELHPVSGGSLPTRATAREVARHDALRSLKAIRKAHVEEFRKPWPGAEHGKVTIGRAIDAAILDLEETGLHGLGGGRRGSFMRVPGAKGWRDY